MVWNLSGLFPGRISEQENRMKKTKILKKKRKKLDEQETEERSAG